MCNQILPGGDSSTFVDQIFRIFDKDNNGTIDFKEFMIATDMTSSGSPEEKLEWAFKVRYLPPPVILAPHVWEDIAAAITYASLLDTLPTHIFL